MRVRGVNWRKMATGRRPLPLLQLPPLQPPSAAVNHPGPGQVVIHVVPPPASSQSHSQQPLNKRTTLMDSSNFKILADVQGRFACVTLLQTNGPWIQLPKEFVDSVYFATQRLSVCELVLKHHQLKTLPRNFGQLSSLFTLDLSFNQLEAIPDVVCQLHFLQHLYLQHNQISSVPRTLGSQLTHLKTLYLQYNKLPILPAGVCNCTSLQVLNVDSNHIETFSEEVGKMENLKQLHASCNALKYLPTSLYKLSNLEELYLSNNNIQHIHDIHTMTALKQLHLANNQLQFLPLCIAHMHQLQGLTLTGNSMRFPPLSACRTGISNMQKFMLEKMKDSVLELGNGDALISNLYYTGSDYELETGNESPHENID